MRGDIQHRFAAKYVVLFESNCWIRLGFRPPVERAA